MSNPTPLEMWLGAGWCLMSVCAMEMAGRAAMVTIGEAGIMEFRMSAKQSATSRLGVHDSAGV